MPAHKKEQKKPQDLGTFTAGIWFCRGHQMHKHDERRDEALLAQFY